MARLESVDFTDVVMRGQKARRTVCHFGYRYGYESWKVASAEALPAWLLWLRDRCAALARVDGADFVEALATRYPAGAGIGWHRDAPMFGPVVAGVSLQSACRMRFRRGDGASRRTYALELAPRSGYVLSGPARSLWQHSIPMTKALRHSLTFRTVRSSR